MTHQLDLLPRSDWTVVLHDGAVAAQGHYDELMSTNPEFSQLINSVLSQHEQRMASPTGELKKDEAEKEDKGSAEAGGVGRGVRGGGRGGGRGGRGGVAGARPSENRNNGIPPSYFPQSLFILFLFFCFYSMFTVANLILTTQESLHLVRREQRKMRKKETRRNS